MDLPFALFFGLFGSLPQDSAPQGVSPRLLAGGPFPISVPCLAAEEEQRLENLTRLWTSQPRSPQPSPGQTFALYPMGGNLDEDIRIGNYVDLDPRPGLVNDFSCNSATYDGHDASDAGLRTFAEQDIGVPVFAVADGTVLFIHDGEPDRNVAGGGKPNLVILGHPTGLVTSYLHLRRGSVRVNLSQSVTAGQEIGQVGSSGNSSGPHLHFAVRDAQGIVEPFGGLCNPLPSLWRTQAPFPPLKVPATDCAVAMLPRLRLRDGSGGPPIEHVHGFRPPYWMGRNGVVSRDEMAIFWVFLGWLPVGSHYRFEFIRPDGLALSYPETSWNNLVPYNGSWWAWGIPQDVLGMWTLRFHINGDLLVEAPYEVVAGNPRGVNRAPLPLELRFDPWAPEDPDPIACRITSSALIDDPDYDVLAYRYVWEVNGTVVRSVRTAARSDTLRHDLATTGDNVRCSVTPDDGTLAGPASSRSVTIR